MRMKIGKIICMMEVCGMSGYNPPYEITNKILILVAMVSEKIGQITERENLKSKPHLRKNYLKLAIQKGLIKMTIPDVPKSKNQRYIKL